ncbi:MAG: hypothetical protein KAS32_18665 [Candidatus Peribacteraceae bacterium]|nr:hypothetical protein [Candidatus Peribacteraceae bacterium]
MSDKFILKSGNGYFKRIVANDIIEMTTDRSETPNVNIAQAKHTYSIIVSLGLACTVILVMDNA